MKKDFPYIIGLDLGVTSIGWAVVEIEDDSKQINHKRLVDIGVRIFESVLDEKNNTNASIRRGFRSTRKRIRRRKHRLQRIKHFLIKSNLLNSFEDLETVKNTDPYALRYKALISKLSDLELARVLLHLSKRRGFKSNRKDIDKEEGGRSEYGSAVKEFGLLRQKYRSVGEALYLDEKYLNPLAFDSYRELSEEQLSSIKYGHQKRNRRSEFLSIFTRAQIQEEIELILHTQQKKGNEIISDQFISKFLELWSAQRSFFNPDKILSTIGKCSIFNEDNGFKEYELRAPINSFGYHIFRSYQSVLNFLDLDKESNQFFIKTFDKETNTFIKVLVKDIQYLLQEVYKQYILTLKDFNTDHLRAILEIDDSLKIAGEYEKRDKETRELLRNKKGEIKYEYKIIFKKQQYLRDLMSSFTEHYEDLFEDIQDNLKVIDRVFIDVLTKYREEEDLRREISKGLIENNISFDEGKLFRLIEKLETKDRFGDLSLRAVWELIPMLSEGIHTQAAITKLKSKYGIEDKTKKLKLLPPISDNTLTNPRVKRVISQTRKVVNALIKKYNSPTFIHVELGRDLKNSEDVKSKISAHNKKLTKRREKVVEELKTKFSVADPKRADIQRYMLWQDQSYKCMISRESIAAEDLFTTTEIDHAIPWSRVADDSYTNRILVTKKVNQEKKNKTPFEYFGSDENSKGWKEFVNFVNSLNIQGRKKGRLTSQSIEDGFAERDLNDTRYASRYIKDYFESHLEFRKFDRDSRVVTVNGGATSIVRTFFWDFQKDRNNDRHHAMDALTVAITTRSMIKRLNDFSKTNAIWTDNFKLNVDEVRRTVPKPWEGFYADLHNRVFAEGEEFEHYKNDPDTKKRYGDIMGLVKPLFVSRAPSRDVGGTAHAETIYALEGENEKGLKILSVRKDINSLSASNLSKFGFYSTDSKYRELVKDLTSKEKEQIAKGALVVSKDQSEFKKTRILSTKVGSTSNSAKPIPRGNSTVYVESGQSMVRVDVFQKDGKHYLIPIYTYDTIFAELPNGAITAGKSKSEWTLMDNAFEFRFSLYKNDFIRFKRKKDSDWEEGYYISTHSSTGAINYINQAGKYFNISEGKGDRSSSLGVKTSFRFEKYTVDILGKKHKVKQETRLLFNLKYKKRNGISESIR